MLKPPDACFKGVLRRPGGFGGPGGGFGGPGGGFRTGRSSGKPLLLPALKTKKQDHQNH